MTTFLCGKQDFKIPYARLSVGALNAGATTAPVNSNIENVTKSLFLMEDFVKFEGSYCVLISRVIEIFRGSKGWFTCDKRCQYYKIDCDIANNEFKYQRSEEQRIIADAKSNVGFFSSFGADEANCDVPLGR